MDLTVTIGRGLPIAFAHRGASGYLPENTVAAFQLALQQGAGGIESDVWPSRDGVPVLVHDRLLGTAGHRRSVTKMSAAELADHAIPSLEDLYAACGIEFELSLDIESLDVTTALLDVADAAGATRRLWACHEDPGLLLGLRARSADVRLVCSTKLEPGGLDVLLSQLVDAGVNALNLRWSSWNEAMVAAVHAAGLLAFGWDAHQSRRVARLLELGVDAIYSDFPDRLVDDIRAWKDVGPE
jgi:glycerophosphoryl diester phosphodiesterase